MTKTFARNTAVWFTATLTLSFSQPASADIDDLTPEGQIPPACELSYEISTTETGQDGAVAYRVLPEVDPLSGPFGARLLGAIHESKPGNALVSPLGAGAVLAMLSPGAKEPVRSAILDVLGAEGGGEGGTGISRDISSANGFHLLCQLMAIRGAVILHGAGTAGSRVELDVANGAFLNLRLDLFPSFQHVLEAELRLHLERMNFRDSDAVERINGWVSMATGGAIPQVVSELEPDDVLVLANAMRFKGEWRHPFDPERTVSAPFHLGSGDAMEVPTMHADELPARYREENGIQAVALPYGRGSFELVVVLPEDGTEPGEALQHLASNPAWLGGDGFEPARGSLSLPRVSLDTETSLLPALGSLGLATALEDPQAFAGIAAPAPTLSRVLQSAMLEVDEEGTEAAAATAAVMSTRSAMIEEESFQMRVDRPFALAVRYRASGAILFLAWVADPAQG